MLVGVRIYKCTCTFEFGQRQQEPKRIDTKMRYFFKLVNRKGAKLLVYSSIGKKGKAANLILIVYKLNDS